MTEPDPHIVPLASRRRSALIALVAGLVHAGLLVLAFPPFAIWPLASLIPLPFVWLATRPNQRPMLTAFFAFLGALPAWLYECSYVINITGPGYVPMAVAMNALTGLFVWLIIRLVHRFPRFPLWLTAAVLWCGIEVFRGEIYLGGYPWFLIGHPTIDAPLLPAAATTIGAYGVSFLTASLGTSFLTLRASGTWSTSAIIGFLSTTLLWVLLSAAGAAGFTVSKLDRDTAHPPLQVAVIQTNLPQDNKLGWSPERRVADFARFVELTRAAAAATPKPALIVWPETMFPGFFMDDQAHEEVRRSGLAFTLGRSSSNPGRFPLTAFRDQLLALQAELAIPMLVGAMGADNLRIIVHPETGAPEFKTDARYNSAFALIQGKVWPVRYDKIDLTPFGEYMPGIRYWPWLQQKLLSLGAHGMSFDLGFGTTAAPLAIPITTDQPLRVATPICFEATNGVLCRDLVVRAGERQADLLVNLTNDGWFADFEPGRQQHLQAARWRSVELGTPMVRAANTGISAMITSSGRLLKAGVDNASRQSKIDGILSAELAIPTRLTTYAQYGDLVRWPLLSVACVFALLALFGRASQIQPEDLK